jgi:hypothetical protein
MKKFGHAIPAGLIVCILLTATANCYSQTLTPKATPACGGYFSAGGKSLSWTMGETFNTTLISGTKMLTQGEQQPYIFLRLINLKIFIEGFYNGSGQMQPVLLNDGLSADPTACDTITVELHNATSPYDTYTSANVLLHTNGTADVRFPISVLCNSYYIAIRHRNSIETWSKDPVKFDDAIASLDFTSP